MSRAASRRSWGSTSIPPHGIGKGVMLDHGSGLVIGRTAVMEDDVSIVQNVILGGTGKETGDRHPKIRRGVLIGAGNVVVGHVQPFTSVVGVPARPAGPIRRGPASP